MIVADAAERVGRRRGDRRRPGEMTVCRVYETNVLQAKSMDQTAVRY
jgi:hypothetical protein